MEYFFSSEADKQGRIILTGEEHLHCTKVKRHKPGETIEVINGRGQIFQSSILEIKRNETLLDILEVKEVQEDSKHIIVGISPTKNPSRLEWFVEKATEIGAHKIFIIQCDRSDRKAVKEERLKKISISAIKQSGRVWLPEIQLFPSFYKLPFEEMLRDYQKFIAYCETPEPHVKTRVSPGKSSFIAIGPEGDFTREEVDFAIKHHCEPVSLGPNRLRTETAGLYALTCLMLT